MSRGIMKAELIAQLAARMVYLQEVGMKFSVVWLMGMSIGVYVPAPNGHLHKIRAFTILANKGIKASVAVIPCFRYVDV